MSPADIYTIVNTGILIPWLLLIVAPKWKFTKTIVLSGAICLIVSGIYLLLMIKTLGSGVEMDFSSLEAVKALFQNDTAVVMGWMHYIAFDLFIGMWEVENAQKHGISHWLVIPCLLLTLMAGPIGLILYFIVRGIKTKKLFHPNFN